MNERHGKLEPFTEWKIVVIGFVFLLAVGIVSKSDIMTEPREIVEKRTRQGDRLMQEAVQHQFQLANRKSNESCWASFAIRTSPVTMTGSEDGQIVRSSISINDWVGETASDIRIWKRWSGPRRR